MKLIRNILYILFLSSRLSAIDVIDIPIVITSADDGYNQLKIIENKLSREDAFYFRIGFEHLDIETIKQIPGEFDKELRRKTFIAIIDGISPRKIILIGCMAYARQMQVALNQAAPNLIEQRRVDLNHAQEILHQVIRRYILMKMSPAVADTAR